MGQVAAGVAREYFYAMPLEPSASNCASAMRLVLRGFGQQEVPLIHPCHGVAMFLMGSLDSHGTPETPGVCLLTTAFLAVCT